MEQAGAAKELRGEILRAEALSCSTQVNGAFIAAGNSQRDAGRGPHAGNHRERAIDLFIGQQALHNSAYPVVAHLAYQPDGLPQTLERQPGVSDSPAQIDDKFAAFREPPLSQQVARNGVSVAGSKPGQNIQNQRSGHKYMAFCEETHRFFLPYPLMPPAVRPSTNWF